MTRKEQIIEASTNWANKEYEAGEKFINSLVLTDDEKAEAQNDLSINTENERQAFQEGARWADRTMIEKACEWLRTNLCEHYADEPIAHKMGRPISGYISFFEEPPVAVIGDFRKAMQEGE